VAQLAQGGCSVLMLMYLDNILPRRMVKRCGFGNYFLRCGLLGGCGLLSGRLLCPAAGLGPPGRFRANRRLFLASGSTRYRGDKRGCKRRHYLREASACTLRCSSGGRGKLERAWRGIMMPRDFIPLDRIRTRRVTCEVIVFC
jgi:hypothetical protein